MKIMDAYFIVFFAVRFFEGNLLERKPERNKISLNYKFIIVILFSTHTLEIPGKLEAAVAVEWQDR